MKQILLLIIVVAVGWNYYNRQTPSFEPQATVERDYSEYNFTCDGRQHCSQMTSRAEAEFFTRHCPNTKMDGDDDGIPCENDSRF